MENARGSCKWRGEGRWWRAGTAERLLKRPDKCAVETDTHGRTCS